jgi:hypothetical protein
VTNNISFFDLFAQDGGDVGAYLTILVNKNVHLAQYKLMYTMYYTVQETTFTNSTAQRQSCLKCKTKYDSIINAFWECYTVQRLLVELESWHVISITMSTYFKPVCLHISRHMAYGDVVRYNGLDNSLITHLEKHILKTWESINAPSLTQWKIS